MTKILSYNILVGGATRVDAIEHTIRLANPDVVGLVEATNKDIIKELAQRLDMDYHTNISSYSAGEPSLALLSRLPILSSRVYMRPGLSPRSLLEVVLQEEHGETLTLFVTHLIAEFFRGRGGDRVRQKEVQAILRVMRANRGPHALIGDFNSLAPGDAMKASYLLRYLVELDKRFEIASVDHHGHPSLNYVLPPQLRFLGPVLRRIPRSQLASLFFNEAGSVYAPRGSIRLLKDAGYVDCFRYLNPRAWGFTCPSAAPAGRIDYCFANPLLATRLTACEVVHGDDIIPAYQASDHLPLLIDFPAQGTESSTSQLSSSPTEIQQLRSES